jgi:hypothetical protein
MQTTPAHFFSDSTLRELTLFNKTQFQILGKSAMAELLRKFPAFDEITLLDIRDIFVECEVLTVVTMGVMSGSRSEAHRKYIPPKLRRTPTGL